jgi:hypothetical protein
LAVGVGPVTSIPQARNKMLFVLGAVENHSNLNWDTIIVTTVGASVNISHIDSKTHVYPMPLLEMEAGRKRLMKEDKSLLSLGGYIDIQTHLQMNIWSLTAFSHQVPFSAMEFNSRCLNGAVGNYCRMDNGYDIQVRKHLAFGSAVYCPKDRGIIGDLVDYVIDPEDFCLDRHLEINQEPVADKVSKSDYVTAIEELIRRI